MTAWDRSKVKWPEVKYVADDGMVPQSRCFWNIVNICYVSFVCLGKLPRLVELSQIQILKVPYR